MDQIVALKMVVSKWGRSCLLLSWTRRPMTGWTGWVCSGNVSRLYCVDISYCRWSCAWWLCRSLGGTLSNLMFNSVPIFYVPTYVAVWRPIHGRLVFTAKKVPTPNCWCVTSPTHLSSSSMPVSQVRSISELCYYFIFYLFYIYSLVFVCNHRRQPKGKNM